MSLYETYRPTSLKTFYGNEDLKSDLQPFFSGKRPFPNALLFTGPSGCGKTTLALIFARRTGASEIDITMLDAADFRGIDNIREIRRNMWSAPLGGKARVWILDECHKLTNEAQNALLKALESPPKHVFFGLCTTNPEQLLPTILTRCTQFTVEELSTRDMTAVLRRVCDGEKADVPEDVLKSIAKQAKGSARAAISMLERVLGRSPEDYGKAVEVFQDFESRVGDLCKALLRQAEWKQIAKLLGGIKEEPETVRRQVLKYMSSVLRSGQDNPQAVVIIDSFKDSFFYSGEAGLTLAAYLSIQK